MAQFDEAAIFNAARKIDAPGEREAYLKRVCGDNQAVYQQVSSLLRAYDEEPGFLESPPIEIGQPIETAPISEVPGTIIGHYKLLEQIGEGGFAVVYMAEQQEPVRRTVALKLIKLGMDTHQVIARFEAERQALAMMDHPGIASVYDAGATATGRPYFVMQLIRGVPITQYCDQNNLSTKERLQLFLEVCRAVQHAHQKGIIHRDIKPTNVLVALHDGKPVPKVIDFGIAKATRLRLTEKTLYTNYRQIIGTPQYMSPEQAEFSDLDIDTRSDIYSLGVLLYELLTSTTPCKPDDLQRMSYDEICRNIRQGDPPTPSKSLSTLGDGISEAASQRQTDPGGLRKLLRGDLDWVVMKALEKDRSRRYRTADALATDIQRYLTNKPVEAGPPSVWYRLKKFGRRYRMQVAALITLLAMVTLGLVLSAVALVSIAQERDQARDNLRLAQELIRDALLPASELLGGIPNTENAQRANGNLLEEAIRFHEQILEQVPDDSGTLLDMARACRLRAGLAYVTGETAEPFAQRSISLLESLVVRHADNALFHNELAEGHVKLAELQFAQLRYKDAAQHHRVAAKILEELIERFPSDSDRRELYLQVQGSLAYNLHSAGDHEAAERCYRRALESQGLAGAWTRARFAELLMQTNRYEDAERTLEQAQRILEQLETVSYMDHLLADFWMVRILMGLGELSYHRARSQQSEDHLRRAIELGETELEATKSSPFAYKNLGWSYHHLSEVLVQQDRLDKAEEAADRARQMWGSASGRMVRHNAALATMRFGELRHHRGDADGAHEYFRRAKEDLEKISRELPSEPYCQKRLIVLLAHCPDPDFRDPRRAVEIAQLVKTDSDGPLWRYLALSQYRSGAWAEAKNSIERSMELRAGGDPLDWMLLAMAQWQLGSHAAAVEAYGQAEKGIASGTPILYLEMGVLGFQRLRAEAAGLLASEAEGSGK